VSLEGSHWIRGYFYDADGNAVSGATVTVRTISGTDETTNTTTTIASGYYQINVQHVCNDGDLIEVKFETGAVTTSEFIRVNLDDLTQEVNATLEHHFKIVSSTIETYLPLPKWDGANSSIQKDNVLFNFKQGSIESVDIGINTQPLRIMGYFWIDTYTRDTVSGKVEAFIHIQNEGEKVTISSVNSTINAEYVITSFKFRTVKKSTKMFEWEMTLEYAGG